MKTMKKMDLVIVEWEDAGLIQKYYIEETIRPFFYTSVGFVLSQDKDRIVLATDVPRSDGSYCVSVLPRGMIQRIRRVKEVTRKRRRKAAKGKKKFQKIEE